MREPREGIKGLNLDHKLIGYLTQMSNFRGYINISEKFPLNLSINGFCI